MFDRVYTENYIDMFYMYLQNYDIFHKWIVNGRLAHQRGRIGENGKAQGTPSPKQMTEIVFFMIQAMVSM